ncbi:melanocortin receptor 5-like [Actinia tenebrosa]|uniref:Melanocortin receptor 5-like n=1 Tax=Actinia tenebrosa TaxID=6105 RepID=A0A6P8H792_ACTTE|nr:melanocortin receptor 5-like [Actinia tenebrosa]
MLSGVSSNLSMMPNSTKTIQCMYTMYFIQEPSFAIGLITVVTCFLTGILSITGAMANSLVCGAILRNRDLQNYSNILLLLLSVNDFLVAFVTQPLYIVRRVLESQHSYICWITLCYRSLWNISIGVSFLVVTLISCERCFALFHPFKYKIHVSVPRLLLTTLLLSGLWIVFVLSRFFGLNNESYYYITTSLLMIFIIIITIAHVKIFILARRHHVQISMTSCAASESNETSSDRKPSKRRRNHYTAREAKIAKSTAFIVGAVFVCYFPLMIALITSNLINHEYLFHYYVFPWTDVLVFLNCVLNPAIYCWRSRELRTAIVKLIGVLRKKSKVGTNQFISKSFKKRNKVNGSQPKPTVVQ